MTRLAQQRMSALELANVAEARRRRGLDPIRDRKGAFRLAGEA